MPAFGNDRATRITTALRVTDGRRPLAFSTDSYVVRPLFFAGRRHRHASPSTARSTIWRCAAPGRSSSAAGFIIEEGLPMDGLRRIV